MNELSEYYQSIRENKPIKTDKKPHKGNWSLYYSIGNKEFLALENKPYAMLVKKRNELSVLSQYKRAIFSIKPFVKG